MIISSYFIMSQDGAFSPSALFGGSTYIRIILLLRSVMGYLGVVTFFASVQLIPVGDAMVLSMLSPFVASALSVLILKEPWYFHEVFCIVMSFGGAIFVVKPPFLFGSSSSVDSSNHWIGVSYSILSAFSAGCAYLFVRMLGTSAQLHWSNVCFTHGLFNTLFSIPVSALVFQENLWSRLTWKHGWLVAMAGLVGGPSQILMTIGMQREKSGAATAMRMSDVFFSFIWQAVFTTDAVSGYSVIGAMLVLCSIVIILVFKKSAVADDVESDDKDEDTTTISSNSSNDVELSECSNNESIYVQLSVDESTHGDSLLLYKSIISDDIIEEKTTGSPPLNPMILKGVASNMLLLMSNMGKEVGQYSTISTNEEENIE